MKTPSSTASFDSEALTMRMPCSFQSVTDQASFEPGRWMASTKYSAWPSPALRIP